MTTTDMFTEKLYEVFTSITDIKPIGSGGQKKVYRGIDLTYGEIVLKLIELHSENTVQRALRELEIASRLEGIEFPNLYKYDYVTINNINYLYVIEEYIKGITLREYQNQHGKVTSNKAIQIGCLLLNGLKIVHKNNLVHRDLKPENIIITKNRLVLIDFGIARDLAKESITADVALFGPMTIGYAAPEQIKNQKQIICNRTDLFSWGVIIYELVTGNNPFIYNARNREEVILNTLTKNIPQLQSGNNNLDLIVSKCLEKTVHRRPTSCDYILKIIEEDI